TNCSRMRTSELLSRLERDVRSSTVGVGNAPWTLVSSKPYSTTSSTGLGGSASAVELLRAIARVSIERFMVLPPCMAAAHQTARIELGGIERAFSRITIG